MKRLNSIETDQYSLEVYECQCGFHIGLDFTYIDQIGDICVFCPNCAESICTNEEEQEEE